MQSSKYWSGLVPLTGTHQAVTEAQEVLQGSLLQQAAMSYIDIFRWTTALPVFFMPCGFLLKKAVTQGDVAAH
jgi:hypothetical protein